MYFNILEKSKIPELDGIRAFAILLVLMRHGIQETPLDSGLLFVNLFENIFFNGWLGVDLFFVLSGFLVGQSLINVFNDKGRHIELKKYFLKRVLRILPLYVAILVIVFAGFFPKYPVNEVFNYYTFSKYALFLQDYLNSFALIPLWSLAVEEKFYILAPVLVYLLCKLTVRSSILFLLTLIILPFCFKLYALLDFFEQIDSYGFFFWNIRAPFHHSCYPIMLGLFIAWLAHLELLNGKTKAFLKLLFIACVSASIIILICPPFLEKSLWFEAAFATLFFSICCSVAVFTIVSGLEVKFLCNKFLRIISKLSYALYLVHYLCIPLSVSLAKLFPLSDLFFWFLYLGFSTCLALVLHFSIEKPFLILKSKL